MKTILPSRRFLRSFTFCLFFISAFFSISNAQIINTYAGLGTSGFSGDGGPATAAEMNMPYGVASDASGNIYIATRGNCVIRKVNSSGTISTFAGNGHCGFAGDGGQATAAEIYNPYDVATDATGNLYIADGSNNRIRKVSTSGVISTIAGRAAGGFSGDGGQATAAELNNPTGITADGSGNIYIIDNNRVREVNTSGIINTVVGIGTHGFSGDGGQATVAEINMLYGVTVDGAGNMYIADEMNYRIRKINTSGIISTIAGNGVSGNSGNGGPATAAELGGPTGVTVDAVGNVYITDAANENIRKINTSGIISKVAGHGAGYSGDGGQATVAEFDNPRNIAFDNYGNYYIADEGNNVVRVVYLSLTVLPSVTANVTCNGGSNGSASITAANGTTPYTYSWSGGQTTSSATSLTTGTYTITVTDADGITGSATATITQPTALSVSASVTTNVSCNGGSNGIVSSTPSGGVSPYTYSWSGGGTNSTKTGLSTATYTITLTDNNGCTATASATVTQPTTLNVSTIATSNPTCYSGNTGGIVALSSGGTSPYTYSWSGGGTTASYTGLSAGTYIITLTDKNGCTATASRTLTQPAILEDSVASISFPSGYVGTGTATIGVRGGTTPYTYTWNPNVSITATATGLTERGYTVTVHDKNNCSAAVSFVPDTITATETIYSDGSPTSNLFTCSQDSIVFRITEHPRTTDNLFIKLPDGITYASLLHDSNVTITSLVPQDSIIEFNASGGTGNTFKVSILVNTPACNAQSTSTKYTTIWGLLSADTFSCPNSLSIIKPNLHVNNVSFPGSPMTLAVGNIGEFVYSISNQTLNGSKIDSIMFIPSPSPNIHYLDTMYYLTRVDSVLHSYYDFYSYPDTLRHHHNQYHLSINSPNYIDSNKLKALTDTAYLENNLHPIYLHIPFVVVNCGSANGSNNFYVGCGGTNCDTVPENTVVNIYNTAPSLRAQVDTPFNNGSYCPVRKKDTSSIAFTYTNIATTGVDTGFARADSMRIYLYWQDGVGTIKTSSIKINGVPVWNPSYDITYGSHGYTVDLIDLTKDSAGIYGQPFGPHSIRDWDGSGHADQLAEGQSFKLTATFVYDTLTCPSLPSASTIWLPAVVATYNNQCFTLPTTPRILSTDSVAGPQAEYQYSYIPKPSTDSVPSDISSFNNPFTVEVCPNFSQAWSPNGFNFDCPNGYYQLNLNLPLGYHLYTGSHLWRDSISNANIYHTNTYSYNPLYTVTNECTLKQDTLNPLIDNLNPPLLSEYYNSPVNSVVRINFGNLVPSGCNIADVISCITIPLELDCAQIPLDSLKKSRINEFSFTLQYVCDSGCSNCENILTSGNFITYNHCDVGCGAVVPYTNEGWSFLRTNLGYINQNIAVHDYYSTCDSGINFSPTDAIIDTSILNLSAGYPGDQVEAKVTGGYSGLVDSAYSNKYLQIRYDHIPSNNNNIFEIDPTKASTFVISGCRGVTTLNGIALIMPSSPDTSITHSPFELNFSIDSALLNTNHVLYDSLLHDKLTESISLSADIHLRVISHSGKTSYSPGQYLLNLRTEYMCVNRTDTVPPPAGDTNPSCDSWGNIFYLYQPSPSLAFGNNQYVGTTCSTFGMPFGFVCGGGGYSYYHSDFPNEFRPYAKLDSIVKVFLPPGYIYSYTTFQATIDNYISNSSDNYFRSGDSMVTFPITPYRHSNISNPVSGPGDTVTFRGLNNSCWPLTDQKFENTSIVPGNTFTVYTQPQCNVPDTSKFYFLTGFTVGTQQTDPSFQYHYQMPGKGDSLMVVHQNPLVYLNFPTPTNDSTNIVTFKFALCDNAYSSETGDAWFAVQNFGGDSLVLNSATLVNLTTFTNYTNVPYTNDTTHGVIFNLGFLNTGLCDTLLLTATINPNSKSCPPPTGGDTGAIVVRYGNICSGTVTNPDSSTCQNNASTFTYHVYPADLELTFTNKYSDTVTLCGGRLIDSLTIESSELGTISNPMIWIKPPTGVSVDSVRGYYPCGGPRDTLIYHPDTIIGGTGIGGGESFGWNLNKDLKLHGLRGTLGLSPGTDSNKICLIVYMTMDCRYHNQPIIDSATGISTCSLPIYAIIPITPVVDSSCCVRPSRCWASNTYDTILNNTHAKALTPYYFGWMYKPKILIEGTFTVDTNFAFITADVSFAPNASINIVDSSTLDIQIGGFLHAACDSMWKGITIHPGSNLVLDDELIIQDAETAIYAINTSSVEGLYHIDITTFNKNYRDIVVTPYPGHYDGTSRNSLYTCRNFDSILSSVSPQVKPYMTIGNWGSSPFDTLLIPHSGERTSVGWTVDSVGYFSDTLGTITIQKGSNSFDNINTGILSENSNTSIYTDLFQNMITNNSSLAGIAAYSTAGNKLIVGGARSLRLSNKFRNVTTGVYANGGFSKENISYNNFHFDTTTVSSTYGIITSGPMAVGSTITIDSNIMDSATIGVVCILNRNTHAQIDSNAITGANLCNDQFGVLLFELGDSNAIYSVKSNIINNLHYGVVAEGTYADTIYKNSILLTGDTGCSNPVAKGIDIQSGSDAQIVANTIGMRSYGNSSYYSGKNFTGIYVENSPTCHIACDSVKYLDTAIVCNGAADVSFSVWGNIMKAGADTGSTGIEITNSAQLLTQNIAGNPSDNQWIDSFNCKSYVTPSAYPPFSQFDVRSGATYNPDGGSCSPPISISVITGSSYDCTNITPRFLHSLLDSIAETKIRYLEYPDTSMIISKMALTRILWSNDSLLTSDSILHAFNDSILTTSLGKIMQADASLINGRGLTGSDYSYMFSLIPASNIEVNMQTVGQIMISVRASGVRSLTSTQIIALQLLANKCPYTDGVGVYQARTMLAYYNHDFTIYNDEGCEGRSYLHKPVKNEKEKENETSFNLYPNPNNGSFTLVYNLGNETSGKFEIYNDISMEIGEYLLNSSSGSVSINNQNLRQGLYFYKVFTQSGIKKVGKIVIIR